MIPTVAQRGLADKLQLHGIDLDKNAIQRIECGKRLVTYIELKIFAKIFIVPLMNCFLIIQNRYNIQHYVNKRKIFQNAKFLLDFIRLLEYNANRTQNFVTFCSILTVIKSEKE